MQKLVQNYKVGSVVVMTDDALENYGEKCRNVHLVITDVYLSTKTHQGFDEDAGCALYSTREATTAKQLTFDLYDWELTGS